MRRRLALFTAFIATYIRHQMNFFDWIRSLLTEKRRASAVICPLMIRDPLRFRPPIVFCDIPKTRARYLGRIASGCAKCGTCRPRQTLKRAAQDETSPPLVFRHLSDS